MNPNRFRCPACRTRRTSFIKLIEHCREKKHKLCNCGGLWYAHRRQIPTGTQGGAMEDGMKTTEWFPGHIKPVRIGVYQQMSGAFGTIGYQRWNGQHWYGWCETPERASKISYPAHHDHQNDPWRGLAQEPKP